MEAEQSDEGVALHFDPLSGRGVLDRDGLDGAVAANLAHLRRNADAHASLFLQAARLLDGGLQRTEALAPVHQRDRQVSGVLQAERPIEGRVAPADDDARLAPEDVLAPHEVMKAPALPVVDAVDLELAGLEGAVACRDD